jgi:hypothetical protein
VPPTDFAQNSELLLSYFLVSLTLIDVLQRSRLSKLSLSLIGFMNNGMEFVIAYLIFLIRKKIECSGMLESSTIAPTKKGVHNWFSL